MYGCKDDGTASLSICAIYSGHLCTFSLVVSGDYGMCTHWLAGKLNVNGYMMMMMLVKF